MYSSGCFTSSTLQIFFLSSENFQVDLFFTINKSIADVDVLHLLLFSPGCPSGVFGQEELMYGWCGQFHEHKTEGQMSYSRHWWNSKRYWRDSVCIIFRRWPYHVHVFHVIGLIHIVGQIHIYRTELVISYHKGSQLQRSAPQMYFRDHLKDQIYLKWL